jgi:hypothetical protein
MGRAKDMMIEMEESGCGEVPIKWVCAELFGEHRIIVNHIKEYGSEGECSYTHQRTKVLPLEDVVREIVRRFKQYYEAPEQECGFDSSVSDEDLVGTGFHKEYDYILPDNRHIESTSDALINLGLDLDNEELFEDIVAAFNNDFWVFVDPYGSTADEELQFTWNQFSESVCKLKRNGVEDKDMHPKFAHRLNDIVAVVRENIKELMLTIPEGMPLHRCVYYNPVPEKVEASNIWAPPADKASSQRMSRKGQSRFYASFDPKTPLEEATNDDKDAVGLLGRFKLKHDVQVLDLSDVPYRSFLDVEDVFSWHFLTQLAEDISQPVDERNEPYRYVPTQIMRDVFEKYLPEVQGIRYRSCKCPGKINVVMFWDNKTCGKHIAMTNYEIVS